MLPKRQRLPLRQYQQFFNQAKKIHTRHFIVYKILNVANVLPASSQAAVIIPKKKIAAATARNAMKRRIRAALSTLLPNLVSGKYVVYVKMPPKIEFTQLIEELRGGLQ